jgi:hypothetical protein
MHQVGATGINQPATFKTVTAKWYLSLRTVSPVAIHLVFLGYIFIMILYLHFIPVGLIAFITKIILRVSGTIFLDVTSGGQSFWLQIQRPRVQFPSLSDFLRSRGSGTGSTQPREDNWWATWMKKQRLLSRKPRLMAVGIRCDNHATVSTRKGWH